MLNIVKGLDGEHIIEELDEDTLEELYNTLLKKQYNPHITRMRKNIDLEDPTSYGKYVKILRGGKKKKTLRKKQKIMNIF